MTFLPYLFLNAYTSHKKFEITVHSNKFRGMFGDDLNVCFKTIV